MMVIPGSQSLTELSASVEFLKVIATADGLADALKQLSDHQKNIEEREGAIFTAKQEIIRQATALEDSKKFLADEIKKADERKNVAVEAERNAQNRINDADTKQQQLQKDIGKFDEARKKTETRLTDWQADLEARDDELATAQTTAEGLIAEYNDKIAELKKIAG